MGNGRWGNFPESNESHEVPSGGVNGTPGDGQAGPLGGAADGGVPFGGVPANSAQFNTVPEDPTKKKSLGFKLAALAGVLVLLLGVVVSVALAKNDKNSDADTAGSSSEEAGASSGKSSDKDKDKTSGESAKDAALSISERCSESNVAELTGYETFNSVSFCDGNWMRAGKAQTDYVRFFQWVEADQTWAVFDPHGETFTGFPCYDEDQIDGAGIPAVMKSQMTICNSPSDQALKERHRSSNSKKSDTPRTQSGDAITSVRTASGTKYSTPVTCDGSNVLVVSSIIGDNDPSTERMIANALDLYPGATFTEPGACSSVGVELAEGMQIYPVFFEFGHDQAGMCAAKAQRGGNARTLNNNADFSDPC